MGFAIAANISKPTETARQCIDDVWFELHGEAKFLIPKKNPAVRQRGKTPGRPLQKANVFYQHTSLPCAVRLDQSTRNSVRDLVAT
jgi:hypothetical protein